MDEELEVKSARHATTAHSHDKRRVDKNFRRNEIANK